MMMNDYIILKLQGPLQAWGTHSFEGLRPTSYFPTRSATLGLLGACMGIRREDKDSEAALADGLGMAVRIDRRKRTQEDAPLLSHEIRTDYHTIKNARVSYRGLKSHETIQTWREYLMDAEFTLALWKRPTATHLLDQLVQAVQNPVFTPCLGRKCCPLARPLFEARLTAKDEFAALASIPPEGGEIYSESPGKVRSIKIRDVPLIKQQRLFASRIVYVYGGGNVPE